MSEEEVADAGSEEEVEIVLADLPNDELVPQMHDDMYDGLAEEIAEGTNILLARGWSPSKVLDEGLVAGMTIVGIDFRDHARVALKWRSELLRVFHSVLDDRLRVFQEVVHDDASIVAANRPDVERRIRVQLQVQFRHRIERRTDTRL